MTNTYAVTFSLRTGRSYVHTPDCRCVARRVQTVAKVFADTPERGAAIYAEAEQLSERGLPAPKVSPCTKGD